VAQARLWTNIIQQFSQAPRPVLENTRSLIALAVGHEITDWQDWAGCLRGWALAAVGRVQDGIALINKSRAKLSARGAGIWRPYFLALLAEACLTAGLIDDGLATASDALNACAQYDELQHVAQIHCLLGEFFAQAGRERVEQAQVHFEQAIEIAHAQSAKSLELQAATCLARLLAQQGACDRARTILAEIFGWFTEGFNNKALREAKALLDQLGDGDRTESSSKSKKF
jgi:predicted ATPase